MTVEIPREEIIEIKRWWGNYSVIFQRSQPGKMKLFPEDVPLRQIQADIIQDPEGFLAFAQAIYDELKANAPAPEKKPRKERKDKGTHKSPVVERTDTLPVTKWEDIQILSGAVTLAPEKVKDAPRLNIKTLQDSYTITYGDKKEKGFILQNTLKNLKTSLGGQWPEDMHPDDLKLVKEIE